MKRAFSLVELSIVILIVGVLIAGVLQGKKIVNESRLKTARSTTESSPVPATEGLLFWVESTLAASFKTSEAEDSAQLTIWNDLNRNSTTNSLTKTASANVVYKEVGINGLPAVYYAGAAGATHFFSANTVIGSGRAFSTFIVYRNDDTSASTTWRNLVFNGNPTGGSAGWVYARGGNGQLNKRCLSYYGVSDLCSVADISNVPEILSATNDGTNTNFYINGTLSRTSTTTMNSIRSGGLLGVGGIDAASATWLGYIGEIIIFEKALKDSERKDIEQYLGKKWGIKIN